MVYKLTGKDDRHLNSFVSFCNITEQLILHSNMNNYYCCSFHILLKNLLVYTVNDSDA